MNTELEVVNLKSGNNIVFKEIKDKFSNNLEIVYGIGVSLYANHVITEKSNSWEFSSFCTDPVKLFNLSDIIDKRPANPNEITIFNKLFDNKKLDKVDKEYLKNNYGKEIWLWKILSQ